jgi:predicted RNase H-like HicB family nuclease
LLTDYVEAALARRTVVRLDDGGFAGRIPGLSGVVAFADNEADCEQELRSVLEEWLWLGLRMGDEIPGPVLRLT